ncbi:MAG TPA: hypothetical protein VI386_07830 [Candidatus Sulfotelmatobacter sp.]
MLPLTSRSFGLKSSKFILFVCAVLAVFVLGNAAAAQTDNWIGTTGVWSDHTQWDNGIPTAGENIVIGTSTANSTDDFGLSIGTLTLSNAGDTVVIPDGVSLAVSGSISNAGAIQLNSAGTNTFLLLNGNVSLTGKGTLTLGNAGPNAIEGASLSGSEVLMNASTIQGAGNIGNGAMGLANSGTISANVAGGNLFVDVSSAGFNNTGTVQALTGGNLTIEGPANSFLNYNSSNNTLTGGTYTANGGNVYFAGTASGITTLSARVTQEASGQLMNTATGTSALANLSSITSTGVLTTTATFAQPGAFSMAGALNLLPKTSFSVGSLAQIVSGSLTAGQWVFDSNFNITGTPVTITSNSAVLTLSGGTFFNTANNTNAMTTLAVNKNQLRILNFAKLATKGNLTNSGTMTIAKGCGLTIGGTGTSYTQTGGKTTHDGMLTGTVKVNNGSFLGAGSITGNVTVGGAKVGALLSVGDTGLAAQIKITGSYTQTANGKLSTGIGGTTAITQYSQLKVTGAATLNGTLAAPLLGTFVPTIGQTFTVLTAGSVSGVFSNTTIPINSSEKFAVSYTANSVILTVTGTAPAAE